MNPSRQEKKHWTIDDIDLNRIDRERVRQNEDLFYLVACASFVEKLKLGITVSGETIFGFWK